jgi:CRISPR-associated protein Cmr1
MTSDALTVKLETVTPLFLAGAEPRGAPELRPPAFRGALRYWLRAALGGVLGDDVAAVRTAEAAVFGSTDEKLGGAGAVTIRIRHGTLSHVQEYRRDPAVMVTKGGRHLPQPTGRDYLYWSMAESGSTERENLVPAKRFYPPGTAFTLELVSRPGARAPAAALAEAAAALWLLVQLGGVGSRSRRTGGSLSMREDTQLDGLRFALDGSNPSDLADQLGMGLRRVRELFAARGSRQITAPTVFDVLHPTACRVWVLGVWRSPDDALQDIGTWLREARGKLPLHERAIYGLPMQRVETKGVDRRASPLWLTVTPAGDQYAGIATLFRSTFLDRGVRITANGSDYPAPTSYADVEAALTQYGGTEVRYG